MAWLNLPRHVPARVPAQSHQPGQASPSQPPPNPQPPLGAVRPVLSSPVRRSSRVHALWAGGQLIATRGHQRHVATSDTWPPATRGRQRLMAACCPAKPMRLPARGPRDLSPCVCVPRRSSGASAQWAHDAPLPTTLLCPRRSSAHDAPLFTTLLCLRRS